MRGQLWNAVLDMQSGKAKDNCIPSLTETGQMEPFLARVAHNLLQVQIEGLPPVGFSGLCQAILGRKEGVAGKAEGGVMDTQGLKVLPGGQLFLFGKLLWQTGYKEQRIRLLDHLIELEPVEADLVIAGLVAGFELRRLNALQQVERIVLAVVAGDWIPGKLDGIA